MIAARLSGKKRIEISWCSYLLWLQSMVQMTTMCLSASFCFLICITPSIVLRLACIATLACITPSIILLIGKPYWKKSSAYFVSTILQHTTEPLTQIKMSDAKVKRESMLTLGKTVSLHTRGTADRWSIPDANLQVTESSVY